MGSVAWEDDGTLQWELRPARSVLVPGFVSVQVDAYAKEFQPQDRQLVVVETGAELGVIRGTQWWYPGMPLQCKVVNRFKASRTLKRGGVVARIYAVNTNDRERLKIMWNHTLSTEPDAAATEPDATGPEDDAGQAG